MDNNNTAYSRRKMLGALGLTLAASFPVHAAPAAKKSGEGPFYPDVATMQGDKKLEKGNLVQTAGYHQAGDGGAAVYQVAEKGEVPLQNGLYAALMAGSSVNYKMFGAVCDGQADDGVQIKAAHLFANLHNIPVVNPGGEFWIKQTNGIPVFTNVHWGQTVFHFDEQYNTKGAARFDIKSRLQPRKVEVDKDLLLKVLKPGVRMIPELAPYTNCLVFAVDEKDRIGLRAGERFEGQSWAREDFFYVEEHGRIIGDLAWEFKDFTSLMAYPCEQGYLVVEGGTFLLSGNSPGTVNGTKYEGYWRCGISITRSRTIIREQWVGLEKGAVDTAMNPRNGFYALSRVYDVALEDIRLIPWEQDREGKDRDVPAGTYGLTCNRTLNARFCRVTAQGGPVHWGVFGTNLNKQFIIDSCSLNRIDVHFHCWHLYIKDSQIGYRGITVTGGGDLFVENTTVWSRNFISFRRDFGAKWDGAIYIRNCRYMPAGLGDTAVLEFVPADFTYNYPVGYGRTIRVEALTVDYSALPASTGTCWLMRTAPFSKMKSGERLFFPHAVSFKDVVVEGRSKGVRLVEIPVPQDYRQPMKGGADTPNASFVFENIRLEGEGARHFLLNADASRPYTDEYALYPEIRIVNCHQFSASLAGGASLRIERSETGALQTALEGELSLSDCRLKPVVKGSAPLYRLAASSGVSFTNCTVHAPVVDGVVKPAMVNEYGFIKLNKTLRFNHLNTRMGQEVLKEVKLLPAFVRMLQGHHELEPENL
ncbi:hypothetical protein EGT74_12900 [Chitinophaga lutea]|uniref:Pectate lyase superfamily protein domain-containing protein n=1 Tax=Chitinophaga lutea TaxID=2488634 RepID=A0A3N4PMV5_9BACT|nr:hypothetical protein [Chitinophaga lutea]RPE07969.1 hypothetical protein EGT74_12900 [Chitinophaga lutea]